MSGKKKTSPTGIRQMLQARNAGEPEAVLHIGLLERNRIANAAKPPRRHKSRGGKNAIRPMAPLRPALPGLATPLHQPETVEGLPGNVTFSGGRTFT